MTRTEKLALIWKRTHRDYKGVLNGVKTIMVFRAAYGSCLVPLGCLTDAEIERHLPKEIQP